MRTKNENDRRYFKVMGFFVAKKLLFTNDKEVIPLPSEKLQIKDVVWVADRVEPRIYELLPAALIHFPKTFKGLEKVPNELKNIIDLIIEGEGEGPDFRGIKYKKMHHWANKKLFDGRVKPQNQKKIKKIFTLNPQLVKKLEASAKKNDITQTAFLEGLIKNA